MKPNAHLIRQLKYISTVFTVLALLCSISNSLYGQGVKTPKADEVKEPSLLVFTPNRGQIIDWEGNHCPQVLYSLSGSGTDIFLRKSGVSYVMSDLGSVVEEANEAVDEYAKTSGQYLPKRAALLKYKEQLGTMPVHFQRLDVDFLDCDTTAKVLTGPATAGVTNYYLSHCPDGITGLPSYSTLTFENIYPDIDLCYAGNFSNGMKYDLVLGPKGHVEDIRIRYRGFDSISISENKLKIFTHLGMITEELPLVYQEIKGKKQAVEALYQLQYLTPGEALVTFNITGIKRHRTLVIDPWITYYGGSNQDISTSICANTNGKIAITGQTASINFPVSPGAFQTTLADGNYISFLLSLNPDGTRIFSTFIGPNDGTFFSDMGSGVVFDASECIYLAGASSTSSFPAGAASGYEAHQAYAGPDGQDAYLCRFDASGIRLWSTFYGGESTDYGYSVAVNPTNDEVVLLGITNSYDSIGTPGTFQPAKNEYFDYFLACFTPQGHRVWGTYLGGNSDESGSGDILFDSHGAIYVGGSVAGNTTNTFPVLAGYQMMPAGEVDAILSKIEGNGSALIWSTFYGGSSRDFGMGVVVDYLDNPILGGYTESSTNIASAGSYQENINGPNDGFLVKFNPTGQRIWASYLGGSEYDQGISGLATDKQNNIVCGGDTYSVDFPTTGCAYQQEFIGSEDQFITTFNADGTLRCSGLLGMGNASSPNNETFQSQCIAVYDCFVYLCAFTVCNYPVTPNALQTSCTEGAYELAIAKLYLNTCGGTTSAMDFSITDSACVGHPMDFFVNFQACDTTGTTYNWSFPGATPSSSTSPQPHGIVYTQQGNYDVQLDINMLCGNITTLYKPAYIRVGECSESLLTAFNVFTPNQDGSNDVWKVRYEGSFEYFHVNIFNRWGRIVYTSDDINAGWDGQGSAAGTYFYIISAKGFDKREYNLHGTVSLFK